MSSNDLTGRHYRRLLDADEVEGEHPADRIVTGLAEVRVVDDEARAMSAAMSASEERRRSAASWSEYEDVRFQQRCVREERFFDVGYEIGWEAGIAQYATFDQAPEVVSVRRHVHRVLHSSSLSDAEKAVILVEVARSVLCSPRDIGKRAPKKA